MRGALLPCSAALATGLWAVPSLAQDGPSPLEQLQGCWAADGTVQGEPADSTLVVEPRLGGKFYLFRLSSLDRAEPYDAEVTVGMTEGGVARGFWTDTFGVTAAIQGDGQREGDGLLIDYPYTDATFRNHLEPSPDGWRWTIVALEGETETPFAAYTLTRADCAAGAAD